MRGLGRVSADLGEMDREDTPWFAAGKPWHRPTIPEGGAARGKEMVGAWARALADEVTSRCGRQVSIDEPSATASANAGNNARVESDVHVITRGKL